MAPVSSQKAFSCRERTCKNTFADRSNIDRHEKRLNHKPVKYNIIQPLFIEKQKKYSCPMSGCFSSSGELFLRGSYLKPERSRNIS